MGRRDIHPLRARTPRHSPAMEVESHMECSEAARRVLAFAIEDLRRSFEQGDLSRLRRLQVLHRDASTIMAEHRRQAGWAEARGVEQAAGAMA